MKLTVSQSHFTTKEKKRKECNEQACSHYMYVGITQNISVCPLHDLSCIQVVELSRQGGSLSTSIGFHIET